jgi:hypothetical protein
MLEGNMILTKVPLMRINRCVKYVGFLKVGLECGQSVGGTAPSQGAQFDEELQGPGHRL